MRTLASILILIYSTSAMAEDRVLVPGITYKLEVTGEPHLLTPISSAKKILSCCNTKKELESKLKTCEQDKALLLVKKEEKNPVLSRLKTAGVVGLVAGAFILGMAIK